MKQKTVYILSGIPGCGKSKLAKSLAFGRFSAIVSTDNFFIDNTTGEYKFDIKQTAVAHSTCMNKFIDCIYNDIIDTIVVDNTNIRHYEIVNYYFLAKMNNCNVNIRCFVAATIDDIKKCIDRNIHGVPPETILTMALNHEYQKFKDMYSTEVSLLSIT